MKPSVVHLKRKGGKIVQDCDVYIGRGQSQGGWNLKKSEWANEYSAKTYTREESIRLYRKDLYRKVLDDLETWLPKLIDLTDKSLGCWCSPLPCHGEVIADLVGDILKILEKTDEKEKNRLMELFMHKLENP